MGAARIAADALCLDVGHGIAAWTRIAVASELRFRTLSSGLHQVHPEPVSPLVVPNICFYIDPRVIVRAEHRQTPIQSP